MEDTREKSIREIVERAKQEKERILQQIEHLMTVELPGVIEDSRNNIDDSMNLAKGLNVDFNPSNEMESLIKLTIEKLNNLKQNVLELEVNEESLMGDGNSFIKGAQDIIEQVGPAIQKTKENFHTTNRNSLLREFERKKKVQDEIVNLKIEKAKLEGKLEATNNKRDKEEIERRIKVLDSQIQVQEYRLLNFEFQNRDGQTSGIYGKKSEEIGSESINTGGQEPDDGSDR